jgi:hypothetical protein
VFNQGLIQWDELAFPARFFSSLADDARKRRAIGRRNEKKIEAHVLAKLAQLIFHRAACILAIGFGIKHLHSGLQSRALSCHFKKAAILEVGFRLRAGHRKLVFAQRSTQIVAHSRLHELLGNPETGGKQDCKRDKAK